MTVKDIAQLLQAFGSELAETDLPDEADAIELLLRSHTDKYRQMKVAAPGSGVRGQGSGWDGGASCGMSSIAAAYCCYGTDVHLGF